MPAFAELHEREVLVELGDGGLAPVCSLHDLVSTKRASGRPRDLVDVAELSELHGMSD